MRRWWRLPWLLTGPTTLSLQSSKFVVSPDFTGAVGTLSAMGGWGRRDSFLVCGDDGGDGGCGRGGVGGDDAAGRGMATAVWRRRRGGRRGRTGRCGRRCGVQVFGFGALVGRRCCIGGEDGTDGLASVLMGGMLVGDADDGWGGIGSRIAGQPGSDSGAGISWRCLVTRLWLAGGHVDGVGRRGGCLGFGEWGAVGAGDAGGGVWGE